VKFSKDAYWFKSGVYSLLQNLSTLVFGFGGFYLLVRIIDKNQMGGWVLFVQVTSLIEVARVGFLKYGFIKFRAMATESEQAKLLTASLVLNTIFALLVGLAMFSFGGLLSGTVWQIPELKKMFFLYSVTSLVLVPFLQFEFLQHALLDFKRIFLLYFARNSFAFLTILFAYLGFYKIDLFLLAIFNLIGTIIGVVVAIILWQQPIVISRSIDWAWVKKLVHYGKYVSATSLSAMLYGAVDSFMLGSLVSTASVAVYNVASRITTLINIPSQSVSAVIFPQSAKVINTQGRAGVKILYEKSVGGILALVVPCVIFVLLFPEFVIQFIAGPGYLDTVAILKITVFLSVFLAFAFQFGVTLDAIGLPNINFYCTGIFFLINLTLNYFLISRYGISGAAYGTLSTTIIGFVAMQIILRSILQINIFNIFRNMIEFYVLGYNTFKKLIGKPLSQ
jgi:lipopolysaccharide exporter